MKLKEAREALVAPETINVKNEKNLKHLSYTRYKDIFENQG